SAKYQSAAPPRAQGSVATSPLATTSCVTTAGPPATSTTTAGSAAWTRSETCTRRSLRAARWTVRDTGAADAPCITVIVASTCELATLATTTVSSARPSDVDVPSAQYHVVESASADGTTGPASPRRATVAVAGLDDSWSSSTIAATSTAASANRIGARRTVADLIRV